ncbi:MAG TPA: DUF5615 family PIN-like protein [Saprospiraceae bacterium]|nr:DUF5615 family PIN-like protein [Saprospiraceae bacterium]
MLILADESVDFAIIEALRAAGFEVQAIVEDSPGWPDVQVLAHAFDLPAFLITEDKDFGELTYRLRKPSRGILLVRLIHTSSESKAALVLEVLQTHLDQLLNTFSVLDESNLRIKPLK